MRILDENNVEILEENIDYGLGYIVEDKMFVEHHDAINAVEEVWHYETVKIYENGGRDVRKIIDVPGVEAKEAWDEYEDILRYVQYNAEELAERESREREEYEKSPEYRIAELEAALDLLLSGVTE